MLLRETLTFKQAEMVCETATDEKGEKNLYMQGIFIQGGIENLNGRTYPVEEIRRAVNNINKTIADGYTVWGECDHPQELTINLDRVAALTERMWMDGNNGMGRMKIIPTPHGQIIRTLIESGGNLGVSSRGSGNVDHRGHVDSFEMVTTDIVARPSAPQAMPVPVYEAFNSRRGNVIFDLATAVRHDPVAQSYLTEELRKFVESLK